MEVVLKAVPINGENPSNNIPSCWMVSGLVLKLRKDKELGIAQTLVSSTLSGKAVYSDSAMSSLMLPWKATNLPRVGHKLC
jgi:hypothetical protein